MRPEDAGKFVNPPSARCPKSRFYTVNDLFVYAFYLAIRLRMRDGSEVVLNVHFFEPFLKVFRGKVCTIIRNNAQW